MKESRPRFFKMDKNKCPALQSLENGFVGFLIYYHTAVKNGGGFIKWLHNKKYKIRLVKDLELFCHPILR